MAFWKWLDSLPENDLKIMDSLPVQTDLWVICADVSRLCVYLINWRMFGMLKFACTNQLCIQELSWISNYIILGFTIPSLPPSLPPSLLPPSLPPSLLPCLLPLSLFLSLPPSLPPSPPSLPFFFPPSSLLPSSFLSLSPFLLPFLLPPSSLPPSSLPSLPPPSLFPPFLPSLLLPFSLPSLPLFISLSPYFFPSPSSQLQHLFPYNYQMTV